MKIFLAIIAFITIVEFTVCFHYDRIMSSSQSDTTASSDNSTTKETTNTTDDKGETLVANEQIKILAISDDKQLIAYVDKNNKLHVMDISTHVDVYSHPESDKIVYLNWIGDDSLFIGLKSNNTTLVLKTFQLSNKNERLIKTFKNVSDTSTFKSITYSPYTNDVYILIGNEIVAKMYHFDTNGNIYPFPLNQRSIVHPMMLSTVNALFYEDNLHNIWLHKNGMSINIRTNATLLSVVDDTMYYGILNPQGKVQSICEYKNGEKQKLFDLKEPVSADRILVKDDGDVLVADQTTYYDKNNNTTHKLPAYTDLFSENHSFFVVSDNNTYLLNK